MSIKEKEQVGVFEQLKRGEISQRVASEKLKVSERWIRKKLKRYKEEGISGLVHKSRGKANLRKWNEAERKFTINLFREKFYEFEPTYGAEKLQELFGITISRETLRKELICAGLWQASKKRTVYRKRRERKACFGIMIQLDGSFHDWFEGRGPECTLLVFIDDATSKLVWLEFAPHESTDSLMKATKCYVKRYGRPLSLYVDFGTVFSVNTNNKEREKITQFQRAMQELGIDMIHAHSPQAKGRVERVHQTLQSRLIKDMRLAGISTMDAANLFVRNHYIEQHNKKFAKEPTQSEDAHRPVKHFDLRNIFCIKETRVLQQDFTLLYKNKVLQLLQNQKAVARPKEIISIHEHLDHSLSLWIRGIKLFFVELGSRKRKINNAVEYVRAHKDLPDDPPTQKRVG